MIAINALSWIDPKLFIYVIETFALLFLFIFCWHKNIYKKFGLPAYRALQRIHSNEIPRFGGLVIFISLVTYVLTVPKNDSTNLLSIILISLIPIAIVALKEDLFHNVKPSIRVIGLASSFLIFKFYYLDSFPKTGIYLLDSLILFGPFSLFFFVVAVCAIANGMNLIDGVNGLCASTALSILLMLMIMSQSVGDYSLLILISPIFFITLAFLIVNVLTGKIFLGDFGSYSLGLFVSLLTIIFYGKHPDWHPWGAILLLIYPITELLFSFLRRLMIGQSIHTPDLSHLHLKVYTFFRSQLNTKKIANSLVLPVLAIFWLYPLIIPLAFYRKTFFIAASIFIFFILYLFFYSKIPAHTKAYKKYH